MHLNVLDEIMIDKNIFHTTKTIAMINIREFQIVRSSTTTDTALT